MLLLHFSTATALPAASLLLLHLAACRYEKYDTNAVVREKTDDPFQDELNLVADKVQDLQLVGTRLLPGAWE